MKKQKRLVYKVRLNKGGKNWSIIGPRGEVLASGHTVKDRAVYRGAELARGRHKATGELTHLRVYNKNGRIAFERTYGRDPKRSKG